MSNVQKLTLIGNLGGDPEMRYTPNGQAVTNFSLATNRTYYAGDGEKRTETTWFRISAWGKQAENANKYLGKGDLVYIEGRLNPGKNGGPRLYQKNDDTWNADFEVTAQYIQYLKTKGRQGQGNNPEDEDLPF
jgi:single-strand DNA-binding protein